VPAVLADLGAFAHEFSAHGTFLHLWLVLALLDLLFLVEQKLTLFQLEPLYSSAKLLCALNAVNVKVVAA
jgi:hypothetical protein